MATFSAVTRAHILQAIAEHDSRGAEAFLGVYGFPAGGGFFLHEDRSYPATAILGVAHRLAWGGVAGFVPEGAEPGPEPEDVSTQGERGPLDRPAGARPA